MRHFVGVLVGLVVAAALLVGAGWAVQEGVAAAVGGSGAAAPPGEAVPPVAEAGARLWIALGGMAGAGLLLGLVVAGRISPLATFVPSMALLSWTVVYALDPPRAISLVPDDPSFHEVLLQAGRGMITLLTTGVYGMLGVALFVPVLFPSRWVRRDDGDDGAADAAGSADIGHY
jgi:hypothetical protein